MKIAHVIPRPDPLSSEPMLMALLRYRGAGFTEQFVVCPPQDLPATDLGSTGCELLVREEPARAAQALAAADLVHVHCPSAGLGTAILGLLRRAGRPLLFTLYGIPRAPVPLAELCVCVTAGVYAAQSTAGGCALAEMGVDLENFTPRARPPTGGRRTIITRVGRPPRVAEPFWHAMADVLVRHPEVDLRLLGGSGCGNERVRVMAARSDLAALLAETDLLVATPVPAEGGETYAVMAAMAMSIPAVLVDTADMRRCAVPGKTALLLPDGDVETLVAAVETLLRDEDLRHRLGVAARERAVQRFDARDRVRQYEQIYLRVLDAALHAPTGPAAPGRLRRLWAGIRSFRPPLGRTSG